MNLEVVWPGSKVWIEGRRGGEKVRFWRTVARRTRTQIVLADDFQSRFRRDRGVEIGGLSDRIVAIATDEEIAAYEIENAARAAHEKVLLQEESALRALLGGYAYRELRGILPDYGFELGRRGDRYAVRITGISAAQVRAISAAMMGTRYGGHA